MKFHVAALLSSTAVLVSLSATQAAPLQSSASNLEVQSFAQLLDPIPNALEKLQIDDLTRREARPTLIPAQFYEHHHHHYHHHHHFDDEDADIIGGVLGGIPAPPGPASGVLLDRRASLLGWISMGQAPRPGL